MEIKSKAFLYGAYMPFIENGGIFIPTARSYELGAEVYLLLTLALDADDKPALAGEIAWVKDGTGDQPAGVNFDKMAHNKTAGARVD